MICSYVTEFPKVHGLIYVTIHISFATLKKHNSFCRQIIKLKFSLMIGKFCQQAVANCKAVGQTQAVLHVYMRVHDPLLQIWLYTYTLIGN